MVIWTMILWLQQFSESTTAQGVAASNSGELSQIIIPILTSLLGLFGGYFFGIARDQLRIHYEKRTAAVVDLRYHTFRASVAFGFLATFAQNAINSITSPDELERMNPLPLPTQEEIKYVQEKIVEMFTIYQEIKPWLELLTRDTFDAIAKPVNHNFVKLSNAIRMLNIILEKREDDMPINLRALKRQKDIIIEIDGWTRNEGGDQLQGLLEAFETEVARVIDASPFWSQWFRRLARSFKTMYSSH